MSKTKEHTIIEPLKGSLKEIAKKALNTERISCAEALVLFKEADLHTLGYIADSINKKKNASVVYYNKNIHVEPTNICIHDCVFCSYARKKGEDGAWESEISEITQRVSTVLKKNITEVHIVGGVHPDRDINYYSSLISAVKKQAPHVHIKAFTAIEIEFMAVKSGLTIKQTLEILKKAGLQSLPGGGAEIFNKDVRKKICKSKTNSNAWLSIHQTAHEIGLSSNATMLYGHIESLEDRIDHLHKLRSLQDITGGFNAFIPLKYKMAHNPLGLKKESTWVEDLKNFAISRIFLDNFTHLKAYWPMLGKDFAQISLEFGVNDLDGTINDSTKIYSMAGAEEKNPSMTENEIKELIFAVNKIPRERDSEYNLV